MILVHECTNRNEYIFKSFSKGKVKSLNSRNAKLIELKLKKSFLNSILYSCTFHYNNKQFMLVRMK